MHSVLFFYAMFVVSQYGLGPIMGKLGTKLQNELQPGSLVISNVFTIPGWKAAHSSSAGTYIYRVPDCWTTAATTMTASSGQNHNKPREDDEQ